MLKPQRLKPIFDAEKHIKFDGKAHIRDRQGTLVDYELPGLLVLKRRRSHLAWRSTPFCFLSHIHPPKT